MSTKIQVLLIILSSILVCANASAELPSSASDLFVCEVFYMRQGSSTLTVFLFNGPIFRADGTEIGPRILGDNLPFDPHDAILAVKKEVRYEVDQSGMRLGVEKVWVGVTAIDAPSKGQIDYMQSTETCEKDSAGSCISYLADPDWSTSSTSALIAQGYQFYLSDVLPAETARIAAAAQADSLAEVYTQLPGQ